MSKIIYMSTLHNRRYVMLSALKNLGGESTLSELRLHLNKKGYDFNVKTIRYVLKSTGIVSVESEDSAEEHTILKFKNEEIVETLLSMSEKKY